MLSEQERCLNYGSTYEALSHSNIDIKGCIFRLQRLDEKYKTSDSQPRYGRITEILQTFVRQTRPLGRMLSPEQVLGQASSGNCAQITTL